MNDIAPSLGSKRKFAHFGIVFAILGLVLFAYFVHQAGVVEIIAGIKRLGAGFLLILTFSAIRQTVRSLAWIRCFEPPHRLRFRDAFTARIMGDALGNIVPLASMAVSEPSKAVMVRNRVPLMAAVSALAIENILYSLSVAFFIFTGTATLLLTFSLPKGLRYASFGAILITLLVALLGYFAVYRQWRVLSRIISFLGRRNRLREWMEKALPRAQTLENRIYGFYTSNRSRLFWLFSLECCFHLAGAAEVYAVLWFISPVVAPTLLTAFLLESINRIINVIFKFIPLRTGVDEAGTGLLARVLGFTTTIGVTLAIVRKGRDIFWTTVGITLLLHRGLSPTVLAKEAEEVVEEVLPTDEAPFVDTN